MKTMNGRSDFFCASQGGISPPVFPRCAGSPTLPVITEEALMRLRSEPRNSARANFNFHLTQGVRGTGQQHKLAPDGATPSPAPSRNAASHIQRAEAA